MKIKFDKTQIKETDSDKTVKVSFSGGLNGVSYGLTVSGDAEDIQEFLDELKVSKYGQWVELELSNHQSSLQDFKGE
jgi:hypothetical protein